MAPARLTSLAVADDPAAWGALGFAVDGSTCRIGGVALELTGPDSGTGITSWTFTVPAPPATVEAVDSIDGIPTRTTTVLAQGEPARHPNGVTGFDHAVVLSPDLDRTAAAMARLGLDVRRVREVSEDRYGFPARQLFFRAGEVVLELVGPATADPARADRPARLWGLALEVADLDGLAHRLGPLLGRVKGAVQPGRRIATLRREAGLACAVAFMSPGAAGGD